MSSEMERKSNSPSKTRKNMFEGKSNKSCDGRSQNSQLSTGRRHIVNNDASENLQTEQSVTYQGEADYVKDM